MKMEASTIHLKGLAGFGLCPFAIDVYAVLLEQRLVFELQCGKKLAFEMRHDH